MNGVDRFRMARAGFGDRVRRRVLCRYAPVLLGVGVSLTAASAVAAPIGTATEVARKTTADGGGVKRDLQSGAGISAQETIVTDRIGKAVLQFVDDTLLSVGPNSTIRLDSFVFRGADAPSNFVIRASKGAFRFATGRGDHESYKIETPAATIGVRGTQFDVSIQGGEVRVSVTEGEVVLCPHRGRTGFADCVEAGAGQSILSSRTSANVVPTTSLPRPRADLLPLRAVANAGRLGAPGGPVGAATGTLNGAVPRTVGGSALPVPAATAGAAAGSGGGFFSGPPVGLNGGNMSGGFMGGTAPAGAAAIGGAIGGGAIGSGAIGGVGGPVGGGGSAIGGGLGGVGGAAGGALGGVGLR